MLVHMESLEVSGNKKNVCVVTGVLVAQLIATIFKQKTIDVLFIEEHSRNGTTIVNESSVVVHHILSELNIKKVYRITVKPVASEAMSRIYSPKTWLELRGVRCQMYEAFSCLNIDLKNCIFWGEIGSSFLSYLPLNAKICGLDHGTECINRRMVSQNVSLVSNMKRIAMYFCTGFMPLYFRNLMNRFTFAYAEQDNAIHVNCMDFHNKYIEQSLQKLNNLLKMRKYWALVLLETQELYEYAMVYNTKAQKVKKLDYAALYDVILDTLCDIEGIIVKYHPSEYIFGEKHIKKNMNIMKDKCSKRGIEFLGIDNFEDDKIWRFLSAEMYLKYCDISTLVTLGSTASLNIAGPHTDIRCYNFLNFLDGHDVNFVKISPIINPYIVNVFVNDESEYGE